MASTTTTATSTLQRSLKQAKEAFVTGHDGTTPWEILVVCFVVISGSALYGQVVVTSDIVTGKQQQQQQNQHQQQHQRRLLLLVVEAIGVWFPLVLTQTNFLYPWGVIVMMLQTGVAYVLRRRQPRPPPPPLAQDRGQQQQHREPKRPQLDYLTLYRSSIMYLTFVAILAVDFHVFPRRFCKTETDGYGLMDVGAASFCISAGFVSHRSRRRISSRSSRRQEDRSHKKTSLFKPLLHTLPLILIGLIRILANQELDYQEHVSEYGVHWNFFFTMGVLALVPPLVSSSILSSSPKTTTQSQSPSRPTLTVPIFLMSFYQWSLNETGGDWQYFIENAPRRCFIDESESNNENNDNKFLSLLQWNDDDNNNSFKQLMMSLPPMLCNFVTANREGILGCFGYLSLYFAGEWIGYHWIWNPSIVETINDPQQHKQKKKNRQKKQQDHELGQVALFLWIIHLVLVHGFGIPVSRRSTNLSFCTWALAHNVLLLYLLQQLTRWSKINDSTMSSSYSQVPIVFEKVNSYGLIMFLVANLLTGLVNLTVPTLEVSDVNALFIVYGYICAVGIAALLLDWGFTATKTMHRRQEH